MSGNPLSSVENYSRYVAELVDRPSVERSTISVWSASPYTGTAEGDLFFYKGFRPKNERRT